MKSASFLLVAFKKHFSFPVGFFLIFAFPASTNYQLQDFGYGGGGTASSASSNYVLEGIAGEQSAGQLQGTAYDLGPGLQFTNQADVPSAPTFTNPSNYYNKLKIVVNPENNPSDTKFAIAISADNFVSDTRYVQSDDTVGSTLGSEDYQTYVNWGGASGELVIGLLSNTTYTVKVKAMQGAFTETGYGPTASAATVNQTLSFSLNTNTVSFGSLVVDSVNDSPINIETNLSTNSENGGIVYVTGTNAGLQSALAGHTIGSVSGDLTSLAEGFGAIGVSVTQTSGGPLVISSPYDQSGNTVGIVDTVTRNIFYSNGPISGGSGIFMLKVKPSAVTPSAGDYSEILTVVATGRF
jgi:hypothetical protein